MPVFFHIGYPKTATTWLQSNLFPYIKNVQYFDKELTDKYFTHSNVYTFDPLSIKVNNNYTENKVFLFSSEGFVTSLNHKNYRGAHSKACADKIQTTFPDAQIILFIRNQKAIIASAYQQYIKSGGTFGIKRYLYSRETFSLEHLLFNKQIEYYDSLFGKKNVNVFLFEDFCVNPKVFTESFCKHFNFQVELDNIDYSKVNQGLKASLTPFLIFLNYFHKYPIGRKTYLFHIPKLKGAINTLYMPLYNYKIFGRHINQNDLLSIEDIEFLNNYYSKPNRLLSVRLNDPLLAQKGYIL